MCVIRFVWNDVICVANPPRLTFQTNSTFDFLWIWSTIAVRQSNSVQGIFRFLKGNEGFAHSVEICFRCGNFFLLLYWDENLSFLLVFIVNNGKHSSAWLSNDLVIYEANTCVRDVHKQKLCSSVSKVFKFLCRLKTKTSKSKITTKQSQRSVSVAQGLETTNDFNFNRRQIKNSV